MRKWCEKVYKLKTDPSRKTNHDLTREKAFLCCNLFNTSSLIIREEVTRVLILISQVEPLSESKTKPPRRYSLGLQDPSSTPLSPRSPLKEPHRRFITTEHGTTLVSLNLCLVIQTPM